MAEAEPEVDQLAEKARRLRRDAETLGTALSAGKWGAECLAHADTVDALAAEVRARKAAEELLGGRTAEEEKHRLYMRGYNAANRDNINKDETIAELRADIAANDRLESQEIAELRGRLEAAEKLAEAAHVEVISDEFDEALRAYHAAQPSSEEADDA